MAVECWEVVRWEGGAGCDMGERVRGEGPSGSPRDTGEHGFAEAEILHAVEVFEEALQMLDQAVEVCGRVSQRFCACLHPSLSHFTLLGFCGQDEERRFLEDLAEEIAAAEAVGLAHVEAPAPPPAVDAGLDGDLDMDMGWDMDMGMDMGAEGGLGDEGERGRLVVREELLGEADGGGRRDLEDAEDEAGEADAFQDFWGAGGEELDALNGGDSLFLSPTFPSSCCCWLLNLIAPLWQPPSFPAAPSPGWSSPPLSLPCGCHGTSCNDIWTSSTACVPLLISRRHHTRFRKICSRVPASPAVHCSARRCVCLAVITLCSCPLCFLLAPSSPPCLSLSLFRCSCACMFLASAGRILEGEAAEDACCPGQSKRPFLHGSLKEMLGEVVFSSLLVPTRSFSFSFAFSECPGPVAVSPSGCSWLTAMIFASFSSSLAPGSRIQRPTRNPLLLIIL